MHVLAGVLLDGAGRILVAQRPPGKHLAGMWEFPGGKVEPGEAPMAALERELDEELGIAVDPLSFEDLIRVPWTYGERSMLLEAVVVRAWTGEPQALDAAAIDWRLPWDIDPALLAPADRPILAALRLPEHYPITPAGASVAHATTLVRAALARGERLLQWRLPGVPPELARAGAEALLPEVERFGARLMLNRDIEGARLLGAGVHLSAAQLRELSERPLPFGQLVGASCHDPDELVLASALGCDFATLSPVESTASHRDAPPLGWPRFAKWAENASLPVYALGGLGPADLPMARMHAAQGVAGITGFM
ncbi:Nudix family hydrolase [Luteibacter aegosomatissinici]|uniref:Nudix family hydrolase n=1 Tax=Luteibacter aegosomatissinici TaxID=2911539 RepID=UPI001FF873F6|nr:Nudix family hydrolase [Luteibacter aegosomatissinici]UPG93388.1 Nudix family hydrolase [Luteibacter aegosomatissinici]